MTAAGQALAEGGLVLHLGAEHEWRAPEGLETLPWGVAANLSAAQQAALVAAEAEVEAAAAQLHALPDLGVADTELAAYLAARLELARARRPDEDIAAVLVTPDRDHGLEIAVLCRPAAPSAPADDEGEADENSAPVRSERPDVVEPELVVEVAGVSNALHEARTDMATRGLIRALAEEPQAALVVLTAHLFKLLALHGAGGRDESALSVTASPYSRSGAAAVEALDGEVRRRLAERRTSYLESGLRPIDWVSGLDAGERLTLLAELTALSLDLREVRTTALRRAARAEAREIAALCAGELSIWWTPDADFLKRYGKPQLLEMLADMGADHPSAGKLRKPDLATKVAAEAAARRWTPPELQIRAPVSVAPAEGTDDQQGVDGASDRADAPLAAAS